MSEEQDAPMQGTASCERCKRRKGKCDRVIPSCNRCTQDGVVCVYQARRRPGFSAGHRQGLESRISNLEAENLHLRARLSQTPNEGPSRQDRTDNVFQGTYARTSTIVEKKPPLDLVVSSVAVFLRHIHPWFPVPDSQRLLSELVSTKEPSLLLYAIFGASLPFLHDPRLDQSTSDSYWKYIKRQILVETTEEPSFASLEACTILTLDISGMTNGPQVWSRLAIDAKLATLLQSPDGQTLRPSVGDAVTTSPGSRHHCRLFWAVYALDSFIAMTTSHPPLLTEIHVQSFLATRAATWADPQNEMASLYLLQLEVLDIAREIHSAFRDLNTESNRFFELSERPLRWLHGQSLVLSGLATPPLVIMIRAYSHALCIYANNLHSPQGGQESVAEIVDLCNEFVPTKSDQLGWPFAWSIWTAARFLIGLSFRNSQPLPASFWSLLEAQAKMGQYWQVGKKYWRLLSRAAEGLRDGGSPLLSAVVDPRVPTSDLEDQFRVDPVLCHTEPTTQTREAFVMEDPSVDLEFPVDHLLDTWFSLPLAASSATETFSGAIDNARWDI